jgi:hypothetical protein
MREGCRMGMGMGYGEMEWNGIPGGNGISALWVKERKIRESVELGLRWIAIHDA